ncbi:MAG: hypothetical protein ACI8WP_000888, partial [Flavobacteriaceae bacterium]
MKRFTFCICALLASIICHAQNWAELYNQSVEAYNNFEYEDARAYAEQALSDIKQNQSNPDKNFAVILRQLSLVCYDLEDNTAAVSYAKEEIETLIKIGGNQDMNFAAALQNLAVIRMYRSEYGVA